MGCCGHGNEPSGYIKCGELFSYSRRASSWSWLVGYVVNLTF